MKTLVIVEEKTKGKHKNKKKHVRTKFIMRHELLQLVAEINLRHTTTGTKTSVCHFYELPICS